MAKTKTDILNLLLSADLTKVKIPENKVKIERLSEDLGADVLFTCRAIAPDKMEEIQENAMRIVNGEPDLDITEMQIFTVIEGVKDPNLKDKELREKFKALTPKELVNKLLLPGEISRLYRIISDLSGFGDKAVTEVKN